MPKPNRLGLRITHEALASLDEWLSAALAGKHPDPAKLLVGFDGEAETCGTITEVTIWIDEPGKPAVAVTIAEDEPKSAGERRTARIFDLPAFAVMRLLDAVGARYRFNKNHNPGPHNNDRRGNFYVTVSLPMVPNLAFLRAVADCPAGQKVTQIGRYSPWKRPESMTHHDYRRSNMRLAPDPDAKRTRTDLMEDVMRTFDECGGDATMPREAFRQMLADAFAVLDAMPLGPLPELDDTDDK